jgi:hypothetical protein
VCGEQDTIVRGPKSDDDTTTDGFSPDITTSTTSHRSNVATTTAPSQTHSKQSGSSKLFSHFDRVVCAYFSVSLGILLALNF